ncbi:MAG: hypothetical protein OEQ53_11975, partial [Saprospiraceae bacterium]|nr:hypothetical protein [Saprospiraceae bacterium]
RLDYPEHFDAGLATHTVQELYYFARGPQLVNRVVDITKHIDIKVAANRANVTQGPGGENGSRLKARLAEEGKSLSILGDNDESANLNYIKHFMLDIDSIGLRGIPSDKTLGEAHGLEWAECFYYRGPGESRLEEYVEKHAR